MEPSLELPPVSGLGVPTKPYGESILGPLHRAGLLGTLLG